MSIDEGQRLVHRISRRVIWHGWVSGVIAAAIVFMTIGFVVEVFFDATTRDELGRANWPWVVGGVLVFGSVMTWISLRKQRAAYGWIAEGRDVTPEEQRATFRLPLFIAAMTSAAWCLGGLVGFLINLDHSLEVAVIVCVSLWLGGDTHAALSYLVAERTLRPVTAMALGASAPERSVTLGVRNRLMFAWSLCTGVPLMAMLVVGFVGVTKSDAGAEAIAGASLMLAGVALTAGFLAMKVAARSISDPLVSVRSALDKVASGDLEARVTVDDASEVGLLQAGFNRMADGLSERERIRELFGRQVGEEVARAALRGGTKLGGEEREIGALFVDLEGSTSMALAMPPAEVVRLLNRFFRVVVEVVEEEHGFVNKFEGDAAMCVFGAPVETPDPAGQALCAARRMAERLDREVPEIGFAIGVSAGRAVAGNVGAEQRFEYTVIGDPVNEAARLSDLAKERRQQVIASDAALARASDAEREGWEMGESTVLRGRLEATRLASPR